MIALAVAIGGVFLVAAVIGVVEAHREGSTPRFGVWAFIAVAAVGIVLTLIVFGLGHLALWALS
ncbi:MAG: hypothetical protein ACJLS2_02315 [Microcella pacifica]